MQERPHPLLYQVNTRVWLTELARGLGRPATLDDIPDAELDRIAAMGFDWVWFLSVWQTGPAAQQVSRSNAGWRREFQETLPDLKEDDIAGSIAVQIEYLKRRRFSVWSRRHAEIVVGLCDRRRHRRFAGEQDSRPRRIAELLCP